MHVATRLLTQCSHSADHEANNTLSNKFGCYDRVSHIALFNSIIQTKLIDFNSVQKLAIAMVAIYLNLMST
jgi:GR25 family glycosyltransferase involved in LPS biosynthesis